ncbi:methyltransferase domain-containing protein [Sphingomonas paeninsulae]|uniref:Methyltransferase domain-containing protein n=1 Tax=Sphingomonas paeninsulae TaxID=2319844 RepID=A0A494TI09_SPHPE|nr:methyltransferase domain-containing protein [Sphingomonas paeninsulae]AYJ87114.1 methyltransferase domain-containing protein [Sphingomonas paeninsulae]
MKFDDKERSAAFVSALYHAILGRDPDREGLESHVERHRNGTTDEETIEAFLSSPEYCAREITKVRHLVLEREGPEGLRSLFSLDYSPPGEAGRSYRQRVLSGFLDRYCAGPVVLDVGYTGYDNPDRKAALAGAIGIDLDYPGYDGLTLPFADDSVDTVFSSHCLEHIAADHAAIQDWFRVLKVGGFIVCMVPSQALYEKRRFLPSRWNADHKRMYTPSSFLEAFETALQVNTYRVRHLCENDTGFNYALGPENHSDGAYEIELVIEKIVPPSWSFC